MTVEEALNKHLLIYAVRPDYPYEMRHRGVSGQGIFELRFDYETGHLREIHITKSTGSPILDRHAIGSLKFWKAKPHSIEMLSVPVTFKASR
jgi:TonB family protein